MPENMLIMVRMICFAYAYSEESGWELGLDNRTGVSPQDAMRLLFLAKST